MDDLDRFARDLDGAGDDLHGQASRLVRASTLRCEALGKGFAPVRTGFLKGSITSEFEESARAIRGETGPTASYSPFVHDGTSRQAPQPFMTLAADVVEPQFYAAAEAIRVLGG